ncbi:ClpX C4-type zinc finger protein [Bradyrhizobium sp. LTSP849]|uniref:ClpX C4-type zinc finger protein n=1 Tax=Bradyrhizobium sp. LTSP849 TaxID=1615890 RepID=UPI0009E5A8A7|nr:ClpX C4-type zinc finger protein [Bradyrhizobium sp. LTSP849]
MNDQDKLFEALAPIWANALEGQRYNEAILIGVLSFLTFREVGHEKFGKEALTWLSMAIERIQGGEPDHDDPICSFCGRNESKDDLVAGNQAFICSSCSSTAREIFEARSKQPPPG